MQAQCASRGPLPPIGAGRCALLIARVMMTTTLARLRDEGWSLQEQASAGAAGPACKAFYLRSCSAATSWDRRKLQRCLDRAWRRPPPPPPAAACRVDPPFGQLDVLPVPCFTKCTGHRGAAGGRMRVRPAAAAAGAGCAARRRPQAGAAVAGRGGGLAGAPVVPGRRAGGTWQTLGACQARERCPAGPPICPVQACVLSSPACRWARRPCLTTSTGPTAASWRGPWCCKSGGAGPREQPGGAALAAWQPVAIAWNCCGMACFPAAATPPCPLAPPLASPHPPLQRGGRHLPAQPRQRRLRAQVAHPAPEAERRQGQLCGHRVCAAAALNRAGVCVWQSGGGRNRMRRAAGAALGRLALLARGRHRRCRCPGNRMPCVGTPPPHTHTTTTPNPPPPCSCAPAPRCACAA